ncbi:MAG TPA: hypothetical protein VHD36_13015 [Pirellulales bacterium]|nr:hypothetical protein [Pirellulales bacterium]
MRSVRAGSRWAGPPIAADSVVTSYSSGVLMVPLGLNRRGLLGLAMLLVGLGLLAGAKALYARRTAHVAVPALDPTQRALVQELTRALQNGRGELGPLADRLVERDGQRAIPLLIGMIDADNSYDTVYWIGHFQLAGLTGVAFSPIHDGAWWRRWWEHHRHEYPADVQAIAIPNLPKTENGKRYKPFPPETDTLEGELALAVKLLERKDVPLGERAQDGEWYDVGMIATDIGRYEDPHAIPSLIGLIDADNSSATIHGIGRWVLAPLTGVRYSHYHDGAWWRGWWEKHRHEYPADVQAIPIPDLPKTASGRAHRPFPADSDTLQGKLRMAARLSNDAAALAADRPAGVASTVYSDLAQEIAKHRDPHAIPYLIGLIVADKTGGGAIYGVGYFGLCFKREPLTGEEYDESHDAAWWLAWWEKNKSRYAADVQAIEIPDYAQPLVFNWQEKASADASP